MVDISRYKIEVSVNDNDHDNLKVMVDRSYILNNLFKVLCDTNYQGKPCDILLDVIAETDKKIINEFKTCLSDKCLEFKLLKEPNKKQ